MSDTAQHGAWIRHAALVSAPLALLVLILSGAAVSPVQAQADKKPVAAPRLVRVFTGATVFPVSGPPVADGVVVVEGGKILAVGPRATTVVPAGAEVVDCTGKMIMPGLVCTHSHIGSPAGGDASSPIQPEARVLDAIDIRDPSMARARAGGLTSVNIMPGSGHLVSGQTVYLKLRTGRTVEDLAIKNPDGTPAGGLKMANGTNSMREPPFPGTRGKSAALVRLNSTCCFNR